MPHSTTSLPMRVTGMALAATSLTILLWPAARRTVAVLLLCSLLVLRFVLEYRARRGPGNPFNKSLPDLFKLAQAGQLPRESRWETALSMLVLGAFVMLAVDSN